MYAAKPLGAAEHWITPPEPALNRYLLRSRPRAANDNRSRLSATSPAARIVACLALVATIAAVASFL